MLLNCESITQDSAACGLPPHILRSSPTQAIAGEAVFHSDNRPLDIPPSTDGYNLHGWNVKSSHDSPRNRVEAVNILSQEPLWGDETRSNLKRVERMEQRHHTPVNLVSWFQTYPLWILSLKHLNVSTVRLPQFFNWASFFLHVRTSWKGSESIMQP